MRGRQQQWTRATLCPFPQPARPGAARAPPGATSGKPQAPQRFLDMVGRGAGQDDRPFLLFDLNGTLTSHTHKRQSSGINLMRPGIHHLMQLQASPEHLSFLWCGRSEPWPAPLCMICQEGDECTTSSSRILWLMCTWLCRPTSPSLNPASVAVPVHALFCLYGGMRAEWDCCCKRRMSCPCCRMAEAGSP